MKYTQCDFCKKDTKEDKRTGFHNGMSVSVTFPTPHFSTGATFDICEECLESKFGIKERKIEHSSREEIAMKFLDEVADMVSEMNQ